MARRSCAPSSSWDSLLKRCVSLETMGLSPSVVPPPALKPVLSNKGLDESWSGFSPTLWACVGLVTSGSLLVLLLWFIVYRRHSRTSHTTGEKSSTAHTLTAVEQEDETLSSWTYANVQTPDGARGRSLCDGRVEHGLPLPATELGDSALVTAKTGQPAEV